MIYFYTNKIFLFFQLTYSRGANILKMLRIFKNTNPTNTLEITCNSLSTICQNIYNQSHKISE